MLFADPMGLSGFHTVFILAALFLCACFGVWCYMALESFRLSLASGVFFAALLVYFARHLRSSVR